MAGKKKINKNKNKNQSAATSDPAAASNGGETGVQISDVKPQDATALPPSSRKEPSAVVTEVPAKATQPEVTEVPAKETPAEPAKSTPATASQYPTIANPASTNPTPTEDETPKTSTGSIHTPIDPTTVADLRTALQDGVKRDAGVWFKSRAEMNEDLKGVYNSLAKTCEASAAGTPQQQEAIKAPQADDDTSKADIAAAVAADPTGPAEERSTSRLNTPELCARAVSNVRRELAAEAANNPRGTTNDNDDEETRHDSKKPSLDDRKLGRREEAQTAIHPVYQVDFKPGWDLVYDPNHLLPCNLLSSGGAAEAVSGRAVGKESDGEVALAVDEEVSPRSHKARPASVAIPPTSASGNRTPRKVRSLDVHAQPQPISSSSKRHAQHFGSFQPRPADEEDPDAITPAPSNFQRELDMLGGVPPELGLSLLDDGEGGEAIGENEMEGRPTSDFLHPGSAQSQGKGKGKAVEGMEYEKKPADAKEDDRCFISRFASWWGGCIHIGGL